MTVLPRCDAFVSPIAQAAFRLPFLPSSKPAVRQSAIGHPQPAIRHRRFVV